MRTQIEFTLPRGIVDDTGEVHRVGTMRLATARDEIEPLRELEVRQNSAYLTVLLLARTVTRGGEEVRLTPKEYAVLAELAKHPAAIGIAAIDEEIGEPRTIFDKGDSIVFAPGVALIAQISTQCLDPPRHL